MKKLNVLLVDDEIKIREGFRRLFDWAEYGCEVVGEASDGMEALHKIEILKPDIVIMDVNIAIINGLKVIELSLMKYPSMAFIILSGYDDLAYCKQALRSQITGYTLKPVNFEEFGICIDRLKIALYEFGLKSKKDEVDKETQVIINITKYLQEHLAEDISLSVLAERFHFSTQYISQLFKSEIGVNFLVYLTNLRIERAKKFLTTTELPIREIAEQVGYSDYQMFTKLFKKAENMMPSQYRRKFMEVE